MFLFQRDASISDASLCHLGLVVADHLLNAHLDGPTGLPAKDFLSPSGVRSAHLGVVGGHGLVDDLALRWVLNPILLLNLFDQVPDELSELQDSELVSVADVNGTSLVRVHEVDQAVDQVVDVLEGTRLVAVAVDGDVLAFESLDDKVGDDATVIGL